LLYTKRLLLKIISPKEYPLQKGGKSCSQGARTFGPPARDSVRKPEDTLDEYEEGHCANNPGQEKIAPEKAGYINPSFSYPSPPGRNHPHEKTGELQKSAVQRYCSQNPPSVRTGDRYGFLQDTKENGPFVAGDQKMKGIPHSCHFRTESTRMLRPTPIGQICRIQLQRETVLQQETGIPKSIQPRAEPVAYH
jgi:hypothetical protein